MRPSKGYGEKRCEIQGGSQEMAVMVRSKLMVKILITTIQVNFVPRPNSPELSLLKFLPLTYHHSHFLAVTLDLTSVFTIACLRVALFFYSLAVLD